MYPNKSGRNLLYQPKTSKTQTTPNPKGAHLSAKQYNEKLLTASNKKERSKFDSHSATNMIYGNRVLARTQGSQRRTYMKPEIQLGGKNFKTQIQDSSMQMKGSYHSTKGKTTTMQGIQITSKYEKGRHPSESNIKKFVSPNSKFGFSNQTTLMSSNQATNPPSSSRTPMRPANINTQKLQNLINRNYIPNNQNQNQFLTSPSNQISHGDRIVIKSNNQKRVRKSNYEGPISVKSRGNIETAGIKQSGIYTSRTQAQLDNNYMSAGVRNGSLNANLGNGSIVARRGNSINQSQHRRVEVSGMNISSESNAYNPSQGTELPYQRPNYVTSQKQVIKSYDKKGGNRVSIGAKQINTHELSNIIKKFTPIKANLRNNQTNNPPSVQGGNNLQFYNQANLMNQPQPRRKWTNVTNSPDSPQKENLMPEQSEDYEHRSEKTRASRADVSEMPMSFNPNMKNFLDQRDEKIKELEEQIEELKEIIQITNKDKNLALKFNQLLLERLDEYEETPPTSSARE